MTRDQIDKVRNAIAYGKCLSERENGERCTVTELFTEALALLDAEAAQDNVDRHVYKLTVQQRDLAWTQLRTAEVVERELEARIKDCETREKALREALDNAAAQIESLALSFQSHGIMEHYDRALKCAYAARSALLGPGGEG